MKTTEQLDAEYSRLCGLLGDVQFKLQLLSDSHQHIVKQLHALHQEKLPR